MKTLKTLLLLAAVFAANSIFGQVQIDKPIDLTGAGSNAKVTGIKDVSNATDATSAEVIQKNVLVYANAAGSANALTLTLAPAATSYTAGMVVHFKSNQDITGAATINVNGLGAKSIKKNFNVALAANDIKNGQLVTLMYDGTDFQMLSQLGNASGGSSSGGDPTLIYTTTGF